MRPIRVLKTVDPPGSFNWRALAKVVILASWLVIPALFHQPLIPLNYLAQYSEDVVGFVANNTTWYNLSSQGRIFYIYFPFVWLTGILLWYEGWFRKRRKILVVNGQSEGVVMLMVGDPNHKAGHLYDLACVLKGFRHMKWQDFPRPISGREAPPGLVIYYRAKWLVNPLHWSRISTHPDNVTYGYRTLWVDGSFRMRVRHPRRPVLDFELLTNENPHEVENLDFGEFIIAHRNTQEIILKDNYRMTVGEPGVAKMLVRSSMMTLSDDTKNEYIDLLPEEVRERMHQQAKKGGMAHTESPSRR